MPYERRPGGRTGGRPGAPGRPSGPYRPSGPGRPQGGDRSFGDRPFNDRPPRDRAEFGDRPFNDRPPRDRDFGAPPRPSGGLAPRPGDDAGMSIRLDPRRPSALQLPAAEAGVRPGELVTSWVEERLDAARPGSRPPAQAAPDGIATPVARLDELTPRGGALP